MYGKTVVATFVAAAMMLFGSIAMAGPKCDKAWEDFANGDIADEATVNAICNDEKSGDSHPAEQPEKKVRKKNLPAQCPCAENKENEEPPCTDQCLKAWEDFSDGIIETEEEVQAICEGKVVPVEPVRDVVTVVPRPTPPVVSRPPPPPVPVVTPRRIIAEPLVSKPIQPKRPVKPLKTKPVKAKKKVVKPTIQPVVEEVLPLAIPPPLIAQPVNQEEKRVQKFLKRHLSKGGRFGRLEAKMAECCKKTVKPTEPIKADDAESPLCLTDLISLIAGILALAILVIIGIILRLMWNKIKAIENKISSG